MPPSSPSRTLGTRPSRCCEDRRGTIWQDKGHRISAAMPSCRKSFFTRLRCWQSRRAENSSTLAQRRWPSLRLSCMGRARTSCSLRCGRVRLSASSTMSPRSGSWRRRRPSSCLTGAMFRAQLEMRCGTSLASRKIQVGPPVLLWMWGQVCYRHQPHRIKVHMVDVHGTISLMCCMGRLAKAGAILGLAADHIGQCVMRRRQRVVQPPPVAAAAAAKAVLGMIFRMESSHHLLFGQKGTTISGLLRDVEALLKLDNGGAVSTSQTVIHYCWDGHGGPCCASREGSVAKAKAAYLNSFVGIACRSLHCPGGRMSRQCAPSSAPAMRPAMSMFSPWSRGWPPTKISNGSSPRIWTTAGQTGV